MKKKKDEDQKRDIRYDRKEQKKSLMKKIKQFKIFLILISNFLFIMLIYITDKIYSTLYIVYLNK